MTRRHFLCLLLCFSFSVRRVVDSDEVAAEETVNTCVAQSLPSHLLQVLLLASNKILKEQPPNLEEGISNLKEQLALMTKDVFKFFDENKEKLKLVDEVLTHQSGFNVMLNSVLNTILNNNNLLEEMKNGNSKDFQTIKETLDQLNVEDNVSSSEGNIEILEAITQMNVSSVECKKSSSAAEEDTGSELIQNILDIQNKTYSLVRNLAQDLNSRDIFQIEIEELKMENQKLNLELGKRKFALRPGDCNDLRVGGAKKNGVYEIYPDNCRCSEPIKVWCDIETESGGWTVVIARGYGSTVENFTRPWTDYEVGFGDPTGEYWLGNSILHLMTSNRRYSLRLEVTDGKGREKWGQWEEFSVGAAKDKYRLSIDEFSLTSSLGNVFKSHNNQLFTTFDQDNDSSYESNCALNFRGGWWYGKCYDVHPTGILNASDLRQSLATSYFSFIKRKLVPLTKLKIKIKPKSCIEQHATSGENLKPFCDLEGR